MAEKRDLPLEIRRMLAFDTTLRNALEQVREQGWGTTVVLGCDPCDGHREWIVHGESRVVDFTQEWIYRGARGEGATVLARGLDKIVRRNAALCAPVDPEIEKTGLRHQTAAWFAAASGHPVVVVSQSRKMLTLFFGDQEYPFEVEDVVRSRIADSTELLGSVGEAFPAGTQADCDQLLGGKLEGILADLRGDLVEMGDRGCHFELQAKALMRRLGLSWPQRGAGRAMGGAVPIRADRMRAPSAAVQDAVISPAGRNKIIDRVEDVVSLKSRIVGGQWGVRVLWGTRGIGKTRIVDEVRRSLENGSPATWVRYHTVNAGTRLDIATLIDLVEGVPEQVPRPGKSSLVRLEEVLKRLRDTRVVVIVDAAEKLLDPDRHFLLDTDLDEALEMVETMRGHRLLVLLVTQHRPRSLLSSTWSAPELSVSVDKLPPEDFLHYLRTLGDDERWNGCPMSEEDREDLYLQLHGNPRLGELAYAVVSLSGHGFTLGSLIDRLRTVEQRATPAELVFLLLGSMNPAQRAVLRALAAFDTPVPASSVVSMVEAEGSVLGEQALVELVGHRIVYELSNGDLFLPTADCDLVMDFLPKSEQEVLYVRASEELTSLRDPDPCHVEDLRVHFAEMDALLRADEHAAAYGVLQEIDDVLREWNCAHLLLDRRERMVGQLGDDHLEKVNLDGLADLYFGQGLHDKAFATLERATAMARAQNHDSAVAQLHGHLAGFYLAVNDVGRALGYFELALDEAKRLRAPLALMSAREGIANCFRRVGEFELAITNARSALDVPAREDLAASGAVEAFIGSLAVRVTLKLARWFAEQGNTAGAWELASPMRGAAPVGNEGPLRAEFLDGMADIALFHGDWQEAEYNALAAVDLALRRRDAFVLLHARTTLCLSYLQQGRLDHARKEIELARPFRQEGQSLNVLALLALTARLKGDRRAADKYFQELLQESTRRTERESRDFAAWEMRGLALCGLRVHTPEGRTAASSAFHTARSITGGAVPGLTKRLRFLLEQLDEEAAFDAFHQPR
ncbi:diadenylate cyclase [Actinokineospora sp. NPDC004072]